MYRLRGTDAQFIYNETYTSPFVTLKVMVYEPVDPGITPTYSEIIQFIIRGMSALGIRGIPLRVVRIPFDIHHPVWVFDPSFNGEDHIHHVALPQPGDKAALCHFISNILSIPLDPNRPPWHLWVVEGLQNGRIALVAKVHHVLADGMMSAQAIATIHEQGDKAQSAPITFARLGASAHPGKLRLTGKAFIDLIKSYTVELPTYYQLLKQKKLARKDLQRGEKNACGPFMAPFTFLNKPGGQHRLYRYETLPLGQFKSLSKALGCTINSLVMGICSEALRRYFLEVDSLPSMPLVAVMPVGVDREKEIKKFLSTDFYNNSVTVAFVPLDLNIVDFRERLQAIQEGAKAAMEHLRATDGSRMDNFADFLPGSFFRLLTMVQAWRQKQRKSPFANLSISNVPGPRQPLYACNGKLKMVELLSAGNLGDPVNLTVTVWSYVDNLCFSCLYRKDAIPEPDKFNRHIVDIYENLCLEYLPTGQPWE